MQEMVPPGMRVEKGPGVVRFGPMMVGESLVNGAAHALLPAHALPSSHQLGG